MYSKIFLFFFLWMSIGHAQDKQYALQILDTLCSPHFDGRGYYNQGEKRAAAFIKNEFHKNGIHPVKESYYQYFNLPVSTIVGKPSLKVEKQFLKAGESYLVHPSSPTINKKSKLYYLSKAALTSVDAFKKVIDHCKGKFVVVDKSLVKDASKETKILVGQLVSFLKFSSDLALDGVIELEDKLTYTASQEVALRPHIIILKDKFNGKAKHISVDIKNKFKENYQSQNVIGIIEGKQKDAYVYVVGHYDHLGRMGDEVYFPGANDNASGIAMLLSLAKEFAKGEKPEKSIVFICFGAEEIGLVGSKFYTDNPLLPLKEIDFLINLDILGTGDDGIQVVNGSVFKEQFNQLVALNDEKSLLKQIKIRGAACNSDHCFFTEKGVPSFFMYTLGGVAHYHNIYDTSKTLSLTEYENLFVLLKSFIEKQ